MQIMKIDTILMAYRASSQASTKHSPFFVLFQQEMRLPIDNELMPRESDEVDGDGVVEGGEVNGDGVVEGGEVDGVVEGGEVDGDGVVEGGEVDGVVEGGEVDGDGVVEVDGVVEMEL